MNISVVIPNWNGQHQLTQNLPRVLSESPAEVIVVDDKSVDHSVQLLKTKFTQVKLIQNSQNRNFAYTVNRGVAATTSELVCILNTDVRPNPNFLKHSAKHFQDPHLFGITLHEIGFGPALPAFENGFIGYKNGSEKNITQPTFWLSGGSCIVRKAIWDQLGGFDADLFPFYWDDLDLSYRAAKRGFKLLWVPDCQVVHRHETFYSQKYPAAQLARIKETHQLAFIWKNLTEKELFRQHVRGLIDRILTTPGYSKVVFSTLIRLPLILPRRRLEAAQRTVSDKHILGLGTGKGTR